MREFLTNCEHVHSKAPPPVSTEVVAGPKAFIDQCELLARCATGQHVLLACYLPAYLF